MNPRSSLMSTTRAEERFVLGLCRALQEAQFPLNAASSFGCIKAKNASEPRPRKLDQQPQHRPDQTGGSGDHAQVVDGADADEDRDRGQDDADLEAGDAQGKLMVLVKLVLAFGFQVLSLLLDFLLFAVVTLGFLLEVPQRRSMGIAGGCALGQGQGFDDLTTDLVNMALGALGLVKRPLVGGLGLFQD